jgi:hypothetical protein
MAELEQTGAKEKKQEFLDDVDPNDFFQGLQEMQGANLRSASPNQERSVSLEVDAEGEGERAGADEAAGHENKEGGHSHHSSSHTNDLNKAVLIEAEAEGSVHVQNLNLAQEIGPDEVGSSPGHRSDHPPGIGDSLEDSKPSNKDPLELDEAHERAGHKRSQFAPLPDAKVEPLLSEERNRPVLTSKVEKEMVPESDRVLESNSIPGSHSPQSRQPECTIQSEGLDVKCCSGCLLV